MESFDEIYNRMKNAYTEETDFVPDEKSDIAVRLKILAGEIFSLRSNFLWLSRQVFPDTATGKYLDMRAGERGLVRKSAVKASGTVTFGVSEAPQEDITIPSGTAVCTGGEKPLIFYTSESTQINKGETEASAAAVAAKGGAEYNVASGEICSLAASLSYIEYVKNTSLFSGGVDEESDDSLRSRLIFAYQNPGNGANRSYYIEKALSVDGVYSAGVISRQRGNGTVDVYVAGYGAAAVPAAVSKVSSLLTGERELNVDVAVHAATLSSVAVYVSVRVSNGYTFDDVRERCRRAILEYVNSLGVGGSLLLSELGDAIFHVEGVQNYSFDSDYMMDVSFDQSVCPVVGGMSVTEE